MIEASASVIWADTTCPGGILSRRDHRNFVHIILLVAVAWFGGCGQQSSGDGDAPGCVLDSDCGRDQICASNQRCVAIEGDVCAQDADCTDVRPPHCIGDQLTTYGAVCDGQPKTCSYLAVDSQTCPTGCRDGRCNPNPCATVVCDQPPATSCADDQTLLTYADNGRCGGGDCSYEQTSKTCVHGCDDAACVAGPCEENACDMPPASTCEATTSVVYADVGQCSVDQQGAATCDYPVTRTDCALLGGTCDPAEGTCSGAADELGGAVIVEVMANPAGIGDEVGEWFEIVNTSGADIDLSGWTIRSETAGGTSVEHAFDEPPAFAAGQRLLLASGSDPGGDGSIVPDYIYADLRLSNASDTLTLANADGEVVDYLRWDARATVAGHARKLGPAATQSAAANNDPSNWCPELGQVFGSDPNYGTPGQPNPACADDPCDGVVCQSPEPYCKPNGNAVQPGVDTPMCEVSAYRNPECDFQLREVNCSDTQYCVAGVCEPIDGPRPGGGDIIITEIMGDPDATDDDRGEYIELYNLTDQQLSLFTLIVRDDETGPSTSRFVVDNPDAAIPAKGYAVLAANTDSTVNGGIAGAYLMEDSPLKNNPPAGGLTLTLARQDATVIDEAHYGAPTAGVSDQLSLDAYTGGATDIGQANDTADQICPTETADPGYTSGDRGTPGVDNNACPVN